MKPTVTVDGVDCYGELEEDSNFQIICEDESYDGVWACRDPELQKTWKDVVDKLKTEYRKDIQELHAV
ncbi:MAG: hypothetical protein KDH96_07245 [Candidatus Riesia sp.]|nr:hypothetical protein [Candidatus Riesia sp.]